MLFKRKDESNIELMEELIPQHIAFIMDGNGRWAKKKGMPRTYGHHEGTKNIRTLALEANRLGIKAMTVYAFSTENFKRPQSEVDFIFKLPKEFFKIYLKDFLENNIQVRYIGHIEQAPKSTRDVILDSVEQTKNNTGLILCFAFIYGAQDEILCAVKDIVKDVKEGAISEDEISEELFESYLMSADLPPLDYMIRTSGECRLSNFMLWQMAYAEMYFSDVYWPDFDVEELYKALDHYQKCDRRYGGLK
ncbi:isoprenyl transferase [Beduini massiliensis]|uniref:isoprenyl transferase n=1 Tax=Beduini massiliensis TaxID=1585974 RepID=UPI00059AA3FC|nr:isoprenyl transferase [Beduini massiliensis]